MKTLSDAIREDRERAATRRGSTNTERAAVTRNLAKLLNRNANVRVIEPHAAYGFTIDVDGRWFRIQVMPA